MDNSTEGGTAPTATIHHLLPRSQGIAYVAAYVVEALITVIGNLVVLAVFGKNRKLRRRKSHWLLVNQATIDLLAGLIIVPLALNYFVALNFHLWQPPTDLSVIVVVKSIILLLSFASFLNLLLIALERTYATFRPLKHRVISARNYRIAIAVVWFLPVLLPICPRVAWHLKIISLPAYYKILAGWGCGIFLLVVSSYVSIWIKFKRSTIHRQNDLRSAQERKLTASVFLVTAASCLTYVSGIIVYAVAQVLYSKNAISFYSGRHAMPSGFLLGGVNFMINPIIYSFKMPGFRRAAVRLICGNRPRTANAALPLQIIQRNRENMEAL